MPILLCRRNSLTASRTILKPDTEQFLAPRPNDWRVERWILYHPIVHPCDHGRLSWHAHICWTREIFPLCNTGARIFTVLMLTGGRHSTVRYRGVVVQQMAPLRGQGSNVVITLSRWLGCLICLSVCQSMSTWSVKYCVVVAPSSWSYSVMGKS